MKTLFSSFLFLTSLSLYSSVNWKNPDVVCPEKAVAQGIACLDLTNVANPNRDFPQDLSPADIETWKTNLAADLKVCRAQEVLRREKMHPGTFTPIQVQISWMNASAGNNSLEKLEKMHQAAKLVDMPIQTLIGALTQESLLSDLGLSPDGGNYSCGIGQLNISEWCEGMNKLSQTERDNLDWPTHKCDTKLVTPAMLEPFYKLASKNLNGRPAYQIDAKDFVGIELKQVLSSFPTANAATQSLRFKALTSFIKNCQNYSLGIPIKAYNLRSIFDRYLSKKLRSSEVYAPNESFPRACNSSYDSKYYPLHTGWLLAVAMYNAGPSMIKLIEHYHQKSAENLPALNPSDLIEALYWGGEYRSSTNRVHYTGSNQRGYSQTWTKSCVVQRHVARVIQHVTTPGQVLASSLEEKPCAQGIPENRKNSSGIK